MEDTPDFDDLPSKSQRKRDMGALQDIGAELTELNEQQLAGIDLPENLRDAVLAARVMKRNEARRRQVQYIGKLMRQVDPAPIREKLDGFRSTSVAETARLHRIEAWGYDSVFWPDHFGPQWEPVAALAAAAAVTRRLKVGSLVYGVDYRHPIVLAKAAGTIQSLSGGRHEFGLGAGWMESDYREAGLRYERAGLRIERLEEALQIVRAVCR